MGPIENDPETLIPCGTKTSSADVVIGLLGKMEMDKNMAQGVGVLSCWYRRASRTGMVTIWRGDLADPRCFEAANAASCPPIPAGLAVVHEGAV